MRDSLGKFHGENESCNDSRVRMTKSSRQLTRDL